MFKLTKKKVGIGIAAGAVVVAAPFAYSYWTEGGEGSGTAATGNIDPVVLVQDAFAAGDALYPGGDYVDLSGTFTNPNPGPVYIDHISAEVVDTSDTGCTAADFDIIGDGLVEGEIDTGDAWDGLQIKMVNRNANQDACKDVTVNIDYEAHAAPAPVAP